MTKLQGALRVPLVPEMALSPPTISLLWGVDTYSSSSPLF